MIILKDEGFFFSSYGIQISFCSMSLLHLGTWAKNSISTKHFHSGSPDFKQYGKSRKKSGTEALHQTEWCWKLTRAMFTPLIRTRLLSKWEPEFSDYPKRSDSLPRDSLCLEIRWKVSWPSQESTSSIAGKLSWPLYPTWLPLSAPQLRLMPDCVSISPPPLCSSAKSTA